MTNATTNNRLFDVSDEDLEFGGTDWYPIGEYGCTIRNVYENELGQTEEGEPFNGFATTDGSQLSIQFDNFIPLNAEPTPPTEKVSAFVRICTRDGDQDYVSIDANDKTYSKLATGKKRLVALARALGETPSDQFVADLQSGAYNGTNLTVNWKEWTIGKGDDIKKGSFPIKFAASRI